jgi:hypothetical protein
MPSAEVMRAGGWATRGGAGCPAGAGSDHWHAASLQGKVPHVPLDVLYKIAAASVTGSVNTPAMCCCCSPPVALQSM